MGKEIIQGRVFPEAGLGKALLSFLQEEKVTSRSRGGLRIFKNIIPIIMQKKKAEKL